MNADRLGDSRDAARGIAAEAGKLGPGGAAMGAAAGEFQNAADQSARTAFARLGDAIMAYAKDTGAGLDDDVKVAYCPMVQKYWLQQGETIQNPSYGKAMSDCGRINATLGIKLVDQDVFNVPLLLTDPYGHFKPGPLRGMPQIVLPGNVLVEGNPAGGGVPVPATAFRTGHAFLNDIAHSAEPLPGLVPDPDTIAGKSLDTPPPGTYDDELLGLHFITGDGRGNENIALTAMHQIFHAEHNRLVADIDKQINALLTPTEIAAWQQTGSASGWAYGEPLFQAARFVTEMQ